MRWIDELRFDERGLLPVIAQEAETGEVLMLAWADRAALQRTEATGEAHYWSRSRGEQWKKGATSGNRQAVAEIRVDCDGDSVVYRVRQEGVACHTGERSCFHRRVDEHGLSAAGSTAHVLCRLEALLADRNSARPAGSYTTYLFEKGLDKILKKVGEEAAEVVIAAKNVAAHGSSELRSESADLLYHLLVLLRQTGLPLEEVVGELELRFIGGAPQPGPHTP
jgi:phosphoribosyl-AMP cyclohydrolase / phosphoribosyl-ATP pyrophosphohydrolase